MRPQRLALAVGLAVALGARAQEPAQALPSCELPPALERVLRDYERAWQARDAVALSRLFSEDGFVLGNGRAPVRGRGEIARTYADGGGTLALRPLAYATAGALGWIVGGYAHARGADDDGKFVLALRRVDGRWWIAADIDNSNRRPRPQVGEATAEAPARPVAAAVQAVLDAQVEAWNRGDLEGFMAGYWRSPELAFFSGGSVTSGWEQTLARYRTRYQAEGKQMGRLRFDAIEVVPLAADSAVARGAWRLAMSDGKSPHGLFTLVLRRVDGEWRIVHDHTSAAE